MHVISRRIILDFYRLHPTSKSSLESWYKIMCNTIFTNFSHLRYIFPSADQVENLTVFNISGNHSRLIAAIHYNRQKVYIRNILTHAEYDKNNWRKNS